MRRMSRQDDQPELGRIESGTWADALVGARRAAPLTLGIIPFGIAFAAAARSLGLPGAALVLMSAVVFGGSAQYLAITLLPAGVGLGQIVLATFFLNSRHLLMSTALIPQMRPQPLWRRALSALWLSDEAFAVFTQSRTPTPALLYGAQVTLGAAWIGGTALGALAPVALPRPAADAAAFSLVAFFVAAIGSRLTSIAGVAAVLVAGLGTLALLPVVPRGWELLIAGMAGSLTGAAIEGRRRRWR
jgi:branched chain amino acid efflux pump